MILSEIKTMDQKNRTHINQDYLKLLGIEPNSQVKISVDLEEGLITIEKIPEAYREAIRSLGK
jgi:bifunctional DNA-binding transcriptional regulator/antitoxin component of YhaV-PrlF toxin-antitoxin module